MKLKLTREYKVPMVPNFLLPMDRQAGENGVPIEAFSDEDLRRFGAAWTEELLRKARARRKA